MWPIFDQCVPLHEKCNVYMRLWKGQLHTHQLNQSGWPISHFLKFIFPLQSVSVRIQLQSHLWSFLEAIKVASMWVQHHKNILCPVCWIRQTNYIYIHHSEASAILCHSPPRQQPRDFGYFYFLSDQHGRATFVCSHICVRIVSSYQVKISVVPSWTRILSICCLCSTSVNICIFIITDIPLMFRDAFW